MSEPTIIIDTREQRPWRFTGPSRRATVATGADYTLEGAETEIGIERKSLEDLVGSITAGKERFARSIAALKTRRWRCVIVESSISCVIGGMYRSRISPSAVLGAVCAICADGVPVYFNDDAGHAAQFAERWLLKCWQRLQRARAVQPAGDIVDGAASVLTALDATRTNGVG